MHNHRRCFAEILILVMAATLTFLMATANAQTTTAALKGTVLDASGAIVPNASVTLKNEASGISRHTVSNSDGYFTFAAVPSGSYTVTVEKEGFSSWSARSVALNSGDERNLIGINLKPGTTKEVITVEASGASITPEDSGEKSALITEKMLQNVAIEGQNAAEFVKIMPGMAYTAGAVNQASYIGEDQRTGSGPVGNFSANGQRTAALDITSDGAHIIDPGCNCGQAMNTNAEMTSEMKVMTSNFGADESKGPIVINTIGKSGGQQFHGEAYLYNRFYLFNANDWLNNHAGNNLQGQPVAPRPETKYFYPGFQIGGPLTPGRDKLFFFFATQAYRQDVDYGIYHAVVPTQAMRNGDFTQTLNGKPYVSFLNGYSVSAMPNGNGWTNGVFTGTPDPTGTGPALMNTYPLDNVDPSANQGFNYVKAATRKSNMMQFYGKVDYSINDSTKLFVSYNHQHDDALNSLDVLWAGNAQSWAAPTTPYPTPIAATSTSDVITANLTKVFSPTLTNELVFAYTYLNLPNHFQDPSKVERQSLGINYNLLFSHPDPQKLIFPELTGWGDGISNMLNTGFELNGTVYAKKTLPSISDNVVKVWKTHTSKFGFYWERTWNQQPGNGSVNGTAVFSNWGSNGSGNAYADMLAGQTTQYSELNFDVVPAFRYLSNEFYGQDSWKVSRRVTLEYGLRVSHLGPWSDTTGYGFAAWYPNLYPSGTGGSVNGATFPGIEWHKVNPSTPLSGSASRTFYYNPRAGFAWDIFGTGRTVLRGGYGMYHFHDEQNVQNGAYSIVRGSFNSPTLWSPSFASLTPFSGNPPAPSGITALDPRDNQEPRTQSYSFTVAERLPWRSQLEVAYVGNKSDYLSNWNNNFDQINDINLTTEFQLYGWLPNCDPTVTNGGGTSCDHPDSNHTSGYTTTQQQDARPLNAGACLTAGNCLGTLKIIDHKMYSNYNSLQVSWNKQSGHFTFMTNYTFSKALGIRGEGGSATGDPTNLRNNYGTLPNNRKNLFNIAYVYELPTLHNANRILKGAANGWQVSGIVQYQSGADLQAAITSNFGYSSFIPAGTTFMGKTLDVPIQASSDNVLGSPDITLMPKVVCNPRSGLQSHQYVNGNCFAPFATPGQQGTYIFPTLTGPGFFNTDLSVFKNFTWGNSESKKLQFRFSGYNFLNHPITTFIQGDPALNLKFDSTGALQAPGPGVTFGSAGYKTGHRIMQGVIKFTW